jgi:glycogen(starch) synthase
MKILFSARAFLPRIGGLENITADLAGVLTRLGHEVVVLTTTPGDGPDHFPFHVVRQPGMRETLRWMRWCDVVHQLNLSLKGIWPRLLVRRPWVVSHHSWYRRGDGRIAWQDRLKRRVLRHLDGSIAVSRAMADDLVPLPVVIPNAYQDRLFRRLPGVERSKDLVFLGRLVSDKGVDVLLDALACLAADGLRPGLTIIGDGPERPALEAQARRLGLDPGLDGQVRFLGVRQGEELVEILNRHRLLVAPSRYREPFGMVALEGIACGCAVVGSADGGLVEAMGPCGRTFPNGDATALATVLADLLRHPEQIRDLLARAPEHLARHTGESIARAYADLFERAREGHPR